MLGGGGRWPPPFFTLQMAGLWICRPSAKRAEGDSFWGSRAEGQSNCRLGMGSPFYIRG